MGEPKVVAAHISKAHYVILGFGDFAQFPVFKNRIDRITV
jgi:hypothetical protein